MKTINALLIIFLMIFSSYGKLLSKTHTQQHKYKFKKEYILGSWIGKNINCSGSNSDQELIITFEGSDWVAKKVKPDSCGPVLLKGTAPSSWDNKSTYTAKYTRNPTWLADTNVFVKDIDTVTTNQGTTLERKNKGSLDLYDSQWDRNYWLGDWECSGYGCAGQSYTELVNITYEGNQFVAVKKDARGDMCVRTGKKTFWGERPDYLDTENFVTSTWAIGRPNAPEASETRGYIYIKSTDKFVCDEITCIRSSPYQKYRPPAPAPAPRPAPIGGNTFIIPGDVQYIPGEVQYIPGEVQYIPGEVQYIPGDVQYIPGGVQYIPGEVQYIPGDVQYIYGQYIPGQVQYIPGEVQYIPGQTINIPGVYQPFFVILPPTVIQVFQLTYFTAKWNVDGFVCNGKVLPLTVQFSVTGSNFQALVIVGNACIQNGVKFMYGTLPNTLQNTTPIQINVWTAPNKYLVYPVYLFGPNTFVIPQLSYYFNKAC